MNSRRLIACPLTRRTQGIVPGQPRSVKGPMSALGHNRTFTRLSIMSALPPKADIVECDRHVRFVPKADIRGAAYAFMRYSIVRALGRRAEAQRAKAESTRRPLRPAESCRRDRRHRPSCRTALALSRPHR